VELNSRKKLIRITTVPMSLKFLLPGQMKFMQQNGFDVLMISADGPEINDVVASEGCKHIVVPMTRKITPVKDLSCLWQLIKVFKKERPDIVHTHTPKAGLLGMLAAKLSGVKIRIHTVAGLPLMAKKGATLKLLKFIEKLTYSAATKVWPNSFSLLAFIKENNFTSTKKLHVINKGSSNGIDLNRFCIDTLDTNKINEIKKNISYSEEYTYLISIGRLVKDKGITELVNTFKKVEANGKKIKLLLLGSFENDLDPLPTNIIETIKTSKNIIHIEWTKDVEYFLAIANVFIFTSHREGFPNVLLQSGSMQVPIVCTTIPGNVDVVDDNSTGLLFEVGNEIELENKIIFALNNEVKMKEMAHNLKIKIDTHFDRNKIWESILAEYKMMLS
jgi:glycosyltransferase involved in cell wall biosynthesis